MSFEVLGGVGFWLPPLAGALIGYATNYLAIWMLFHPYRQIRVLGFALPFTPGVIPRERGMIAEAVADSIERELLSGTEMVDLLKNSSLKRQAVRTVDSMVEDKLKPFPLPEPVRYQIKLLLSRELVKQIDLFFEERSHHVAESLEVKKAIVTKLNQLDLAELEGLIYRISGKELRFITALGGLLGFVIGCVQVLIFWFTG